MPPQIIGLAGPFASKSFPLGDAPLSFGRTPENTVVLTNARASRHHAQIRRDGAEYVLADLGSANGTLVNGQRLTAPHRLRAGDVVQMGDESFRFDAPATDATLIAAPGISAPPTVPAGPPSTPEPALRPASLPSSSAPARRSGRGRPLLIGLALVGLVLLVACVGGAVVLTRTAGPIIPARPTSAARPTASSANGPVATREPVAGAADWTVLVYLDGDNNLESDAIADFNEMEQAGSSDKVKIVVQFDRIHQDGSDDDTSNGDWDTTKRFLVQQDDDPKTIGSQELADLGELNMGDPQTLADFITWGVREYPAQHYALVLWDHGSSWAGVAFDDTDGQKGITLPELDAALRTAQGQTGVERLDLIGFDACLMAQLDVLQTIAPYGNVGVASAELEPGAGWSWDVWLNQLKENPAQDAATVGESIVRSYGEFYQHSSDDTPTLAAFDLSRVDSLRDDLNALSDAMIQNLGDSYQAVAEARSYVEAYSQPKPEQFSSVDLGDFTRLVGERGAPPAITTPAKALGDMITQARIAEWHGSFHTNATGLSVFFPQVAQLYPDFYDQGSPLPQATSWGIFLKAFHQAGATQVSAPQISNLQLSSPTVGFGSPATLQGTVSGKDIAHIFFFVGVPNGDRSGVELTDVDFIYPPGSSPNAEVPPWRDGANDLSQTWDGTRWALSNGADTIPVLLGPAKYGTDLYGVEGLYTAKDSGEQIEAGLLFEVQQGRATLQTIYGFPKGRKQESQPFEITPAAGDTFTALLRTYTVKDGKLVPDFAKGDTITFGSEPLSALQIPAANGAYVTGFLVRDISGQFSYEYKDITVDNSGAQPVNPAQPTQPAAGPGTQSGTLAFNSADLGFSLEYPEAWQTLDSGNSQVYFYDPDKRSATFLSVDVYSMKQQPDQANQELLKQYGEALAKERDFAQGDTAPFDLAGEQGQSFKYTYTDKDGNALSGTAIVITSPTSGLSYLVTAQALTSDYDGQVDTFNAILKSMKIK